jgi:hypothetical protein
MAQVTRWKITAKARQQRALGVWSTEIRYIEAATKDEALDKAWHQFIADGYQLLFWSARRTKQQ